MAFVDLTKKDLAKPSSKEYSLIEDKDLTFHFILNLNGVFDFWSVARNYIFKIPVTWSECQPVIGFTDSGNIRCISLIFLSSDGYKNELFYFKAALKAAKFHEISK
jgi:hypothetical protein